MEEVKIIGIYSITNLVNGKIYIGQSIDIKNRWQGHKSKLNNGSHCNRFLQFSWNKYGKESFKFKIVEMCDGIDLNKRETYWISYYNTVIDNGHGFNMDNGGNQYKIISEITKQRIRDTRNNISVVQLDNKGAVIKIWPKGATYASEKLGFYEYGIRGCCLNKFKTYKDCIWIYEKDYNESSFDISKYVGNYGQTKEIVQLTLKREFVRFWKNCRKPEVEGGFRREAIYRCCTGKLKTHKGYIWTYRHEWEDNSKITFEVAIVQLSLGDDFIKIWKNIFYIEAELGYMRSNITQCCLKKRNECNGFKWIYLTDYKQINNNSKKEIS